MLEEYIELNRKPTFQEEKLIELLVKKSVLVITGDWKEELMVSPMKDGMMGSLYLFPQGKIIAGMKFGNKSVISNLR